MNASPIILPLWVRAMVGDRFRSRLRHALCSAADAITPGARSRCLVTPPAQLRTRVGCFFSFLSAQTYHAVGAEFLNHLITHCGLTRHSSLLDVGCGCGQLASQRVASFHRGPYTGIDVDLEAVDWCRRAFAESPECSFIHADLRNGYYNASGEGDAAHYAFPFPDNTFDVVLVKSVFTHMVRAEANHYLGQIARVLKPGGRCLATFYFINEESRLLMRMNRSPYRFIPSPGVDYVADTALREYVVAQEETHARESFATAGLQVRSVLSGSWCGRRRFTSFQDLVILQKT